MAYAVVQTGGKQYRVEPGDLIRVEKIDGDPGSEVSLGTVLVAGDDSGVKVGAPTVDGASVRAKIVEQGKTRKIIVFKKKRRKGYRRKNGHRQPATTLEVLEIQG